MDILSYRWRARGWCFFTGLETPLIGIAIKALLNKFSLSLSLFLVISPIYAVSSQFSQANYVFTQLCNHFRRNIGFGGLSLRGGPHSLHGTDIGAGQLPAGLAFR